GRNTRCLPGVGSVENGCRGGTGDPTADPLRPTGADRASPGRAQLRGPAAPHRLGPSLGQLANAILCPCPPPKAGSTTTVSGNRWLRCELAPVIEVRASEPVVESPL